MSGFTMNGLQLSGGMSLAQGDASPPPPPSGMTWDPSYLGSGLVLSNGNKTITQSSSGTETSALATYIVNDGDKVMFSITMDVYDGRPEWSAIGFGTHAADLTTYLGYDYESIAAFTNGKVFYNDSVEANVSTFQSNGAVIDMAVDKVNQTWYWRVNGGDWNNNPSADPATNTGGVAFVDWATYSGYLGVTVYNYPSGSAGQFTINTTSTYSVPSGFTFVG